MTRAEHRLPWPTAEQATALIAAELSVCDPAPGTPTPATAAMRWTLACVNALPKAAAEGTEVLLEMLVEPTTRTDVRWETLLAGAIRYRLRQMDRTEVIPGWTAKAPLQTLWFASPGVTAHAAEIGIVGAPPELRRLGIMLSAAALDTPRANAAATGVAL